MALFANKEWKEIVQNLMFELEKKYVTEFKTESEFYDARKDCQILIDKKVLNIVSIEGVNLENTGFNLILSVYGLDKYKQNKSILATLEFLTEKCKIKFYE